MDLLRYPLIALYCLMFFTGQAQMKVLQPAFSDSITAMILDWHHLPEAMVETVGLAAGARGMDEVPGALHILRPKELRRFSYTDPLRALRTVSGVNIQEEDGYGLRPNIGLRGSGAERSARITLMEDGILIAPAPYTAPAAYYFPSIARMESVEILKGSSQIAFGPQTAGGAINLVTPECPDSASAIFRSEWGSFGSKISHGRVGTALHVSSGSWYAWAEFLEVESDGFKTLPDHKSTGFLKRDHLLKFKWESPAALRRKQSVTFKWGAASEDSHETYVGLLDSDFAENPFQRYASSANDRMQANQQQQVLHHQIEMSDKWVWHTDVYRTQYKRNWYKLDRVVDAEGVKYGLGSLFELGADSMAQAVLTGLECPEEYRLDLKANNRSYFADGIQHRGVWRWTNSQGSDQQVVYGLRWHQDGVDRMQWRDGYAMEEGALLLESVGSLGSAGNRIETAQAFAAYVRGTIRTGALTWTPGLRREQIVFERWEYAADDAERNAEGDYRSNDVEVWLPGVGLHANISDKLNLFAGVHRGFIPPGSSPETLSETSMNVELGTRWNGKAWSGQLVIFRNDYNHLLGSDLAANGGNGSGDLFNGGSALTQGMEIETVWNPLSGQQSDWSMPIRLSYTFTNARFTSNFESDYSPWDEVMDGDMLPYLAPHQGAVMMSLEHGIWSMDWSGRYVAAMRTQAGQGVIPQNQATDAVTILDGSVRCRLSDAIEWQCGVTNLWNTSYVVARRPAGLRPGMPRFLRMGLRIGF